MLPRSCLRCADSKSNSSTRLPRKTITRVSSGWVASMSILLAIWKSRRGRHAAYPTPHRRWGTRTCPIVGEWDGLETTSAASGEDPWAGERRMNAAASIRSNLALLLEDLRLEHELQTAMGGSAGRHRNFSIAYGIGATPSQVHLAPGTCLTPEAPVVPFSRVSASLARPAVIGAFLAPEGFSKAASAVVPVVFSGSQYGGRAGCPNATQPEPVTVSMLFLRPRVGNWQAAYGVCPPRRD